MASQFGIGRRAQRASSAIPWGTVTNAGTMNVVANAAAGGAFTTTTAGGATITLANATASAAGIAVFAGGNNMVINNSGVINVNTITNGGTSNATGILVQPLSAFTPAATDVLTINNSGDIIAADFDGRRDFDPGRRSTFRRRQADGDQPLAANISGNIERQSNGDNINVTPERPFQRHRQSGVYRPAAPRGDRGAATIRRGSAATAR